ncbi:MAG: prepilin-type N-terminal cleavage/methylation domain-containing protein [Pseudomonadota bacterium]
MSVARTCSRRTKRGFTLIELLIVLTIAALLLQGLTQITGNLLRDWSRSAIAMENLNAAIAGIDAVSREIAELKVLNRPGPGGQSEPIFYGEPNQLSMVRPAIGFEDRHDLDQVTYTLEQSDGTTTLVRQSWRLFSGNPGQKRSAATRTVVAEFEGSMEFAYTANLADFSNSWIGSAYYPVAVLIIANLEQPNGANFERVIIINAEADAICARRSSLAECRQQLQSRL